MCKPIKISTQLIAIIFALAIPLSVCEVSEDETPDVISNCFIRDYNHIRCTGDFNVSNILFQERQKIDPNENIWLQRRFKGLEIFNSNVEEIDEKFMQFHGFKFETILIENAPKLRSISPKVLVELKDELTDFRAVNTGLPQYNDFGNGPHENENPFDNFKQLREVYIGEQSRCPTDETLLSPCTCKFGALSHAVPNGWSSGGSYIFGSTTQVTCEKTDLSGEKLKEIFEKVTRSNHEPKHFDVLTIRGVKSLIGIPSDVFSNVSITTIWMDDVDNLKSIHPKAFVSETSDHVAKSIQIFDLSNANFTTASSSEDGLFRAFSSLTNIRVIRLSQCGIPRIPSHAFTPEHPQKLLNNLLYLSLSFDRRRHSSGIKSIGSYAFSGAPKLVELGLEKNFIEEFDSFAFAFNKTSNQPLTIHIGGNPFNDSYGLKPNAFSGAQRPIRILFNVNSFEASDKANDPTLDFIPENVFRPFIEENSENYFEVDYFNVDVWCDCNSKWMFDDIGSLKQNVRNGIRIKRVVDNVVGSFPLSVQCKAESSFECLSNCLSFPSTRLIHCGGSKVFDVKSTFNKLGQSIETGEFKKLVFSSKEIQELPNGAFGSFQFDIIELTDCWNLSSIHPNAFGASTETMTTFSAKNTNLTFYPNFASFPKLEIVRLDDYHPFHLNSSNFDFSASNIHPERINLFVSNATIAPKTFTKWNNETALTWNIGGRSDCSTLGCLFQCKPITFSFDEETVKSFLEANPKNSIQTKCYLECACDLKWMYGSWNDVGPRIGIWIQEYFGSKFYCVAKGEKSETVQNLFAVDVSQFNYGDYFKENC